MFINNSFVKTFEKNQSKTCFSWRGHGNSAGHQSTYRQQRCHGRCGNASPPPAVAAAAAAAQCCHTCRMLTLVDGLVLGVQLKLVDIDADQAVVGVAHEEELQHVLQGGGGDSDTEFIVTPSPSFLKDKKRNPTNNDP